MTDRIDSTGLSEVKKRRLRESGASLLGPKELDLAIVDVGDDGHAIYSFWGLVYAFIEWQKMTEQDAVEWVEYNTLLAIPYMAKPRPEVIRD